MRKAAESFCDERESWVLEMCRDPLVQVVKSHTAVVALSYGFYFCGDCKGRKRERKMKILRGYDCTAY